MAIIDNIRKVSDTVWELPVTHKEGMRVPARIIATEKLVRDMDEAVYEQISNVATLPGITRYALCMPDGLFHAHIHPATETARFNDKTVSQLFWVMRGILQKAIEYQTDVDRMPKSWLLSHREKGEKSPRCGRELKSSKIGGRTAWFCTYCQARRTLA